MEDMQETVVDASVDAGQGEYTPAEEVAVEPSSEGEPVVEQAVDAPKPDANVGDAIKREVQRREEQIKKQYEQQMEEVRKQNAYLEKRARQEGFADVHAYLKAIDELEQRQQIEQESARMGIDPDTYAQYLHPVTQRLTEAERRLQAYEQERALQTLQAEQTAKWSELYSEFPGLLETAAKFTEGAEPEWYNDAMKGYINRGYDPKDAYRLAHAETIYRQKEQEVLARVTGRDERQVLPSNDSPNNLQFDPANMSFDEIQQISERVRRGERITF